MTVHLTGTENLPPFIKSMLDSSYNYHSHELKCEPDEDGFKYKYSVTVSKVPLNRETSECSSTCSTLTSDSQSVRYCVKPLKCSKSVKCVMMIQIKFILLYVDAFGNRVQSIFCEELSTEETLNDVMMSFREMCLSKMNKHTPFHPRISYCIGEVTRQNSRPVNPEDLSKKINTLADSQQNLFGKVTFIADTLDVF